MDQALSRAKSLAAAIAATAALASASVWTPSWAQEEYEAVTPIDAVEPVARVLGGAHHLRRLCDRDDYRWRDQMVALIALEAEDDQRRSDRLTRAFNDGFRAQERLHSRCNAEARRAESALAAEGRQLAEALQDRYLH